MRARNELDRLVAAGQPLHAAADALVGVSEEDAILGRIVATDRPASRATRGQPRTVALVAVGVVAAVAAVAVLETGNGHNPATGSVKPLVLSGATIQMAGYHFRTPAGFANSETPCTMKETVYPPDNGFSAAASADGGCVEVMVMMSPSPTMTIPTPSYEPVDVGSYKGYYNAQSTDAHGDSGATLYVDLPGGTSTYLVLFAQGLTEEQLIAVAESGLPANP